MQIYPKCLVDKQITYSATGYLLPCCWCDNSNEDMQEFKALGFFEDHLKVDNVNHISEILLSDEWTDFFEILATHNISSIPKVCKKFCSLKGYVGKKVLE